MASIFRNCYTRNGKRHYSKKWYIEYRNADGLTKRVPGFVDKRATEQLAARLERDAERQIVGMSDPIADELRRPMAEHVADFHRFLAAKGVTRNYRVMKTNRIKKALEGCRFQFPHQLAAGKLHEWLADFRDGGASIQTSNNYLDAMKSIGKWMVRNQRLHHDPFIHLQKLNTSTDVRRERRVIADEELSRLLHAAKSGQEFRNLSGPDRAVLYLTAVNTGLRKSELQSLTPSSFDFTVTPATVTVEAKNSKRRRRDVLPLRKELAAVLRPWLSSMEPSAPCWTGKWHMRAAHMLKKDLALAGIPYVDSHGRFLDFHAMRHTFISNLARAGVHPSVAKELARHSTIELTMDRYTHVAEEQMATALGTLPPMVSLKPDDDTGKGPVHAGQHAGTVFRTWHSESPLGPKGTTKKPNSSAHKSSKESVLGTVGHPESHCVLSPNELGSDGLGNRCSIQLSYGD